MTLYQDKLKQLIAQEKRAHHHFLDQVRKATKNLDNQLRTIETSRASLIEKKADREVLIRNTPGNPVEIFHSAESPCDRVSFLANFDRVFLTEAVGRNLRPCSACARSLVDEATAA
jgi:hypothetical protein